jgi:hypothetical protein
VSHASQRAVYVDGQLVMSRLEISGKVSLVFSANAPTLCAAAAIETPMIPAEIINTARVKSAILSCYSSFALLFERYFYFDVESCLREQDIIP